MVSAELPRADVERALALLDEAQRSDGKLSPESLREINALLNAIAN